jgi:hypothetical protein
MKRIKSINRITVVCLSFLFFSNFCWGQEETLNDTVSSKDTVVNLEYPYRLPILGKSAFEKGFGDQLQLPLGLNVNYLNVFMDMEITEFGLTVGGRDLTDVVNKETLNFTEVSAFSNGVNFRPDFWLFPFMNVYGLFSSVTGGTNVSLKPTWKDNLGSVLLELPEFSAAVDFNAISYGVGTTLAFGFQNYFISTDINYSRTETELLENQIGILCLSARLGYKFNLSPKKPNMFLATYVGVMNRDFVGADGNNGSINFADLFPDMSDVFNENVDAKIQENLSEIDNLNPIANRDEITKLKAKNIALTEIQTRVNENRSFDASIDYFIHKQMIQSYTFQFGFNFQLNKHWMLRGEYGISDSQRFILTGIQYRFGIPKKKKI